MHIITLWPLQFQILKDFINSKKQIFVVENNASGQLYFLLRKFEKQGIRMKSIRKFNSQPFFKSELLNILEREIEQ
jgi:pyruvate/2-oxoacid:ferredoxin oxidoreductase alpha subunit